MPRYLAASGSFLLGVLCMDLAFDLHAFPLVSRNALAEQDLTSIATYYARIFGNNPMAPLVMMVMLLTIVGCLYQIARGPSRRWLYGIALFLGAGPIALTVWRIVPAATEVAARSGSVEARSDLARAILFDHLICFTAFLVFVALQLWLAAQSPDASRQKDPS